MDTGRWTLDTTLWTLDSGPWILYSGRWTLEAALWTLSPGRWALDAGLWTLGSGWWTPLLTGVPSSWFCLMSRVFCREYVLTWLVLDFFYERYVLHYRTPTEKITIWEIGLDQKKISWTVQKQPSRAIHFRKFLKKMLLKQSPSLAKTTD